MNPGASVKDRDAHYATTGPEVWTQTNGSVDAFVAATGTGGTLAGVARYLKERSGQVRIVLADPSGSALYRYVHAGTLEVMADGSITEGIGSGRYYSRLFNPQWLQEKGLQPG